MAFPAHGPVDLQIIRDKRRHHRDLADRLGRLPRSCLPSQACRRCNTSATNYGLRYCQIHPATCPGSPCPQRRTHPRSAAQITWLLRTSTDPAGVGTALASVTGGPRLVRQLASRRRMARLEVARVAQKIDVPTGDGVTVEKEVPTGSATATVATREGMAVRVDDGVAVAVGCGDGVAVGSATAMAWRLRLEAVMR